MRRSIPARARAAPGTLCPSIPRDARVRCFASHGRRRLSRWRCRCTNAALFTWSEWAAMLGEEIKRAQAAGDPDTGETYYHHWLAALERSSPRRASPTRDDARALPRRLGPRRRPHAARQADRADAGRFRGIGFARSAPDASKQRATFAQQVRRRRRWPEFARSGARGWRPARSDTRDRGA